MVELATPFRFEAGAGPIRRFHPASKAYALLALSAFAMGPAGPYCVPQAGLGLLAVLLLSSRRLGPLARPPELLAGGRFLVPLILLVLVMRSFDPAAPFFVDTDGAAEAVRYGARLATVYLLAELFFRSTPPKELGDWATASLRRLFRPLFGRVEVVGDGRGPGVDAATRGHGAAEDRRGPGAAPRRGLPDPGLYLSLAVDFLPRTFESYRRTREAAAVRGYGSRAGRRSLRRFAAASGAILASFMESSLRSALRTARALEARCYSPDRSLAARPFGVGDAALILVSSLPMLSRLLPAVTGG